MLRPSPRPTRSLVALLAALCAIALAFPAGLTAAPTVERSGSNAPGAPTDRGPVVRGGGVRDLDAGRGSAPRQPLQQLGVDRASRGAAGERAALAPGDTAGVAAPAPVEATNSGAPAATSFAPWQGLDEADSGFEPADSWVAVGPDDVVQTVNSTIRFTNREGASTAGDLDVFEFFDLDSVEACPPPAEPPCTPVATTISGVSNPSWHYDAPHDRWIGMTVGWHCGTSPGPSGFIFGAISTTNDPTGDYYHFYIQYPDYLPDYANVGLSADKITFTANEYVLAGGADCTAGIPFDAASTTTLDWAQMLTFPAEPRLTYDFSFDHFSLRAAVNPKGTTNTIFVVGEEIVDADTSNVAFFRITGTNAANNVTTPFASATVIDLTAAAVVPEFEDPPLVQQPGTELPDDAVDQRPTDAVWQDNVLTFASTRPCVSQARACARVTQLNTGPATPTRRQDMLVVSSGEDTFYPGIAQSQSGILHVVYTESSATQGHTSIDRYQLPSDSLHRLSARRVIANGGAVSYTGQAWGRVVGLAQDPRDTNAVWQANAYTDASGEWVTRVSELQTAGSTFVPLDPVRLLDSRFNNGTTGAFSHGVPKTIDIAGRGGVPDDAVAITGNLTVVGQNGAGYASLTQLPIVNPATSTINFPVGDTRANNVTSPLSAAGGVSITYRAAAGRTAHFILDITGYFTNEDVAQSHTYTDMAPVRVLDSRPGTDIGLSGAFAANVNREFDVAGRLGIPADAKAITGNLTVVGQTRAGYVTLSTDPPPSLPATSTINFPAGDTRANGVTIKLSASGSLWAVYKAPPGSSTHLILDVTGYYLNNTDGARFVALTPGRRMDTRFAAPNEGLTGAFAANSARTLIIEPYQGVPANATAITGNLTVVGQTRAGYVSMTQAATNSPTTSTINFPLGDTRANGVTGPLHDTNGSVGLVYEASGGLTHLILDLTGYFR